MDRNDENLSNAMFEIFIQRSAVTVTTVSVTIAYSDSFDNPQLAFHVETMSVLTDNRL